jgi:hypothetical protein
LCFRYATELPAKLGEEFGFGAIARGLSVVRAYQRHPAHVARRAAPEGVLIFRGRVKTDLEFLIDGGSAS